MLEQWGSVCVPEKLNHEHCVISINHASRHDLNRELSYCPCPTYFHSDLKYLCLDPLRYDKHHFLINPFPFFEAMLTQFDLSSPNNLPSLFPYIQPYRFSELHLFVESETDTKLQPPLVLYLLPIHSMAPD